jgi:mersacidin/lichenicidin family type 2 lantibiotic
MTTEQLVRSWKDEEYLLTLSAEEQALLPDNPAGMVELSDEDLMGVEGGSDTWLVCSLIVTAAATLGFSISMGVSYIVSKAYSK